MRKWTVRIPDDVADSFTDFCATAGISQQAAVEACVRRIIARYEENDRDAEQFGPYVDLARSLDASRRRPPRHRRAE